MNKITEITRTLPMGFDDSMRFEYNQRVWAAIVPQVRSLTESWTEKHDIKNIDLARYEREYPGSNGHCVYFLSGGYGGYVAFYEFTDIELSVAVDDPLAALLSEGDELTFWQYVHRVYEHLGETPEYWEVDL